MGAMVYNGNSKTIAEIVNRLNQGGGGGTTDVDITPTLSSGTKIADYEIDGTQGELYAPTPVTYEEGNNIQIRNGVISATDTTYDDFVGSTHGLVPPAQAGDLGKYLKADGTWSTPSGGGGGTSVEITPTLSSGTKIADFKIDGTSGELYAPSGSSNEPYSEDDIWTGSISLMTDRNLSISNVYSDYDALRFEYQALGGNGVNYALEKTVSKNTLQRPNFVVSDFFLYSNAGVFVCGTMSANNIITTKYVSSGWFQDLILSKIVGIKMGKAKIPVEIYDYAEFDGTGFLTTPYDINADYTLEVIFDADYIQTMSIVGNNMGAGYAHLTIYNNYWYVSAGTYEVILGSYTSGKHTFISNLGGKNILDNTEVSSYTPTDISTPYLIGNRVGSGYYIGKLYEFKLTSINTGNIVYDVVPAKKGNQIGLYDVISDTFTQCSFVTAVGND